MLLFTVLYTHIVLCLDNRASDWHCLTVSVCGHSLLQQSLTVAFQKAPAWAAFPDPSQIRRVFTDVWRELAATWKRFIVCFQMISKQQCRHKGVTCFKRWQRCTWSIQAQRSFSSAQRQPCLSYAHIIIKPTEQRLNRQLVKGDRLCITLSTMCTHLQDTHTKYPNKWPSLQWKSYTPLGSVSILPLIGTLHRLSLHWINWQLWQELPTVAQFLG